jgi:hypothetical protein
MSRLQFPGLAVLAVAAAWLEQVGVASEHFPLGVLHSAAIRRGPSATTDLFPAETA